MTRLILLIKIALYTLFFSVSSQAELLNPQNGEPLLVWDAEDLEELPKNFRSIPELRASGSGQFSLKSLKFALKQMQSPIWIVDLRQESHGFIDGRPFSWYGYENRSNEGKATPNIESEQTIALNDIKTQLHLTINTINEKDSGRIYKATSEIIDPRNILSEQQLIENLRFPYIRFYVQDRHAPDNIEIDRFVSWTKSLAPNTWVHFHCRAGSGRTTTFLVMYDILKNAKTVSLEDIIQGQALIGPKDLSKMPTTGPDWRRIAAENRMTFIERFYEYAKDPDGYPTKSWGEWLMPLEERNK